MEKIITVSIIGCGSRGGTIYGRLMNSMKKKYKIVSLCDIDEEKVKLYSEEFKVPPKMCFTNDDEFFCKKRSDLLVIATLDTDHVQIALKASALGYSLLLEKPISNKKEELIELRETCKKNNTFVMVCHVLRYTWANSTIMKLLNEKKMGRLIHIDHTEQVAYWHFAHSYVRGNWRNTEVAAPMIMAKSCHDLDLLQQYANSKVEKLSSFGDLTYFKSANKPKNAANRCTECVYKETCPYSATIKYLKTWEETNCPQCWPYNVLSSKKLTRKIIETELQNGPYGRCVFECDNNVADNQCVMIEFANKVTATFRVTAFTQKMGRISIFHCSNGQIIYKESEGIILEMPFLGENIIHKYDSSLDEFGHGGGDYGIVCSLYNALITNNNEIDTSLEKSIESHLMAIAAEDSRNNDGKIVYLKDYR